MSTMNQLALLPRSKIDGAYRLGELFAGAGGMAYGAHLAEADGHKFHHVWVTDMDKDACKTLEENVPVDKVICSKVEALDFDDLPMIDGLVFGFPCNDFSAVGERNGINGKYGGLYQWGVKGLKTLRPSFFVAENVGGLASNGLDVVLSAMCSAGYDLWPHTYRFEQYGVPQARHRIIIVGFRKDLNVLHFEHPSPTTADQPITCEQALAQIPRDAPNNERTKQSERVIERLKHIKPGENAFTANLPDHLQLKMKSGAKISQIYKRLVPDKPSYTVTGSGGGGTHLYHWDEPRALTNRERARLQSFPDDFVFKGGKESVRKQIGMAVPPIGAREIFSALLRSLIDNGVDAYDNERRIFTCTDGTRVAVREYSLANC
ncbi:MAG: DNA (cytosine-5-)-methyltransferase [Chloroflexi bacterium]|nr:DNA (cytosine-5-)-methyltransferase [Chloroflexota bacterium]